MLPNTTSKLSTAKCPRRPVQPTSSRFQPTFASHQVTVSADGRRRLESVNHILRDFSEEPGPLSESAQDLPAHEDVEACAYQPEEFSSDPVEFDEDDGAGITVHVEIPEARRYENSAAPLHTWLKYRDTYLDELLRLEGQGGHAGRACPDCQTNTPSFRCKDCSTPELVCKTCLLSHHVRLPFHCVELWDHTDLFFKTVTLKSLGLRFQLGHPPGIACPFRHPGHQDFTVLHTNGIHLVQVDFCGCGLSPPPHYIQLLCMRLWPPTPLEPQTCATFNLLHQFQTLHFHAKFSVLHFYQSLHWLTDGTGLRDLPDGLKSLHLMICEYRHIQLLKRAGRGQSADGATGTAQGELTLQCRACPQPEINLPEDWSKAPADRAWLYRLMINQDCNFRLKNRLRKNQNVDRALGDGWGYFVESRPYHEWVITHTDSEEISTCAGFSALINANSKKTKGDLQCGERYNCVDWIFFWSLCGIAVRSLLLSYDIMCEWSKNLIARMLDLPEDLQIEILRNEDGNYYIVPKFHLEAHGKKCHACYSLNYKHGVGHTDCETPERNWAILNHAAPSTKEMTPGSRQDTLDDLCGFMNWVKTVRLVQNLLKLLTAAIPQVRQHCLAFKAFHDSLKIKRPTAVEEWQVML
ncbi:hypothetical protein OE88DRAFT_1739320 [Heliocybe sulcata]|uniref:CxC2-like cysteine cluster KDZ transposase-associated domain-containing protein n=1 Tax=Heliocybe sulcata TaxID=5364 RepID=A0A5C3MPM8_9AGAM|nr:hypothetical protein OE88DRAFT_1739320 [Heliocybe sulcata]